VAADHDVWADLDYDRGTRYAVPGRDHCSSIDPTKSFSNDPFDLPPLVRLVHGVQPDKKSMKPAS
jgi:hypothetical protein